MSLEKIAELNQLAKKMEEMKKNAINSVVDRKELRVQALKKIQEYMRSVCEATQGFSFAVKTPITIYWLVKQEEASQRGGVSLYFRDGTVDIYQSACASSVKIDDFINKTEKDFYRLGNDGVIRWNDGYLPLIERWHEIKPYIESCAEKALMEKMAKTQKELDDFKKSYETVVGFEA